MLLKHLLKNIEIKEIIGSEEIDVNSIKFNSLEVVEGNLFVAVKGTVSDGHNYIAKAVENGAKVIVCERNPFVLPKSVTVVFVNNSAEALGKISANFYENPSSQLKVVGVTGTNGKTTVASLLYEMFENIGYKCGLISTVENKIHKEVYSATHTTPDPVRIQKLMRKMVEEGCEFCFMEVSSHAIVQNRIAGIEFEGGIFTNLTHDHLDYHKTFDNYRDAKKKFFDNLGDFSFALSNLDDKNGKYVLQNTKAQKKYYAIKTVADFNAKILETDFHGTLININGRDVWIKLIGEFNVYNILAIYATSILLGIDEEDVLIELSKLQPVRGRLEIIHSIDDKVFVIDYAHTPDALKNLLTVLNEIKNDEREIITVFGAGGNRDKGKRPEMGKIAALLSNKVIITSDNPRNEEPEAIMNDIKAGINNEKDKAKTLLITSREEAIKTAIMLSKPGDIIVIAGKGHEEYQEVGGVKHYFSDKEVVLKNIKVLK